jgi:hypothetical protein
MHFPIDDLSEKIFPVMGANGDEIQSTASVIPGP